MEDYSNDRHIGRSEWMHLLGTHIGTGSGTKLNFHEVVKTRKIITGYKFIELFTTMAKGHPFTLGAFIINLNGDLEHRHIVMVERPTRDNHLGKFQYADGIDLEKLPDGGKGSHNLVAFCARVVAGLMGSKKDESTADSKIGE